jgi:hypothetical protein
MGLEMRVTGGGETEGVLELGVAGGAEDSRLGGGRGGGRRVTCLTYHATGRVGRSIVIMSSWYSPCIAD